MRARGAREVVEAKPQHDRAGQALTLAQTSGDPIAEGVEDGSQLGLRSAPAAQLYPACAATRPANGLDNDQLAELAQYLLQKETQEDSWVKHAHKAIPGRTPIDGQTGG